VGYSWERNALKLFNRLKLVLPRDNKKFLLERAKNLMSSIRREIQFAYERWGGIKHQFNIGGCSWFEAAAIILNASFIVFCTPALGLCGMRFAFDTR